MGRLKVDLMTCDRVLQERKQATKDRREPVEPNDAATSLRLLRFVLLVVRMFYCQTPNVHVVAYCGNDIEL